MTTARRPAARRRGRPPSSTAAATRERIVDAARHAFAELGYAATTNKVVADAAGVTTGALYHYFGSKLDLYRAVDEEVDHTVHRRFEAVVAGAGSFVEGLERVLELAHELNNTDPSLARFVGAVRIDVRRNPELRTVLKPSTRRRERFVRDLVDLGVATGELDVADRDRTVALIRTLLIGLVDAVSDRPASHRAAIDAIERLVEGKLIRR